MCSDDPHGGSLMTLNIVSTDVQHLGSNKCCGALTPTAVGDSSHSCPCPPGVLEEE